MACMLLLSGFAAEVVSLNRNRAGAEGEARGPTRAVPLADPRRVWAGDWAGGARSAALKLSRLPPQPGIGLGTMLDPARFRVLLGEHFEVDPRNVPADMIGEHGDRVAGSAARALAEALQAGLTARQRSVA